MATNGKNGSAPRAPWAGVEVPEDLRAPLAPPTIQWANYPEYLRLNGEAPNAGGFFAAQDLGGAYLPGGVAAHYRLDKGLYATQLSAAIIALRTSWGRRRGKFWDHTGYEAGGARKRVDALVLVKDDEDQVYGPYKMTIVGTVNDALTEAYQRLLKQAPAIGAQPWMFWVEFASGTLEYVRSSDGTQETRVTPLVVTLPNLESTESAAPSYVGDDVARQIIEMREDVVAWRERYKDEPADETANGMTFEEAKAVVVQTQKHGRIALGTLFEADREYGGQVMAYIADHRGEYAEQIVAAVDLLQQALALSQAEVEEVEHLGAPI